MTTETALTHRERGGGTCRLPLRLLLTQLLPLALCLVLLLLLALLLQPRGSTLLKTHRPSKLRTGPLLPKRKVDLLQVESARSCWLSRAGVL